MSQEKVDKYKQEKYNRKNVKKKSNTKKILAYIAATVIAVAFIVYIGYSVAIVTGLYTPTTTARHMELSDEELESFRNALIANSDPYVQGVETETTVAVQEATTVAVETTEAVEETTEVTEETTAE